MWNCVIRLTCTPALWRDVISAVRPDPVTLADRFQQLRATSSAVTTYYQKREMGQVEAADRQEAVRDLVSLSKDRDLRRPEVQQIKEILARVKTGKPLSEADVQQLKAVVERLADRIASTEADMAVDNKTSTEDLAKLVTTGVTPDIQEGARDFLATRREELVKLLTSGATPDIRCGAATSLADQASRIEIPEKITALAAMLQATPPGDVNVTGVQAALAENPHTPTAVLSKLLETIRASLPTDDPLLQSNVELAEAAIARHPGTSPADLEKLQASGQTEEIRQVAAGREEFKQMATIRRPHTSVAEIRRLADQGKTPEIQAAAARALQGRGPELLERFTELDSGLTSSTEYTEMRQLAAVADPSTRARMIEQLTFLYTSDEGQACLADIIRDAREPAALPPSPDFKLLIAHLDLNTVYGKLDKTSLPLVRSLVEEGQYEMSLSPSRVADATLKDLQTRDKSDPPRFTDSDRRALVTSIAAGGIIGLAGADAAAKAMQTMPADDYKRFRQLLDKAGNDTERAFLMEALSAGHTMDEIEVFAGKIHTMTQSEMIHKCSLADTVDDNIDEGIRQQFSHSCGPTTVQAVEGEVDPIYALGLRERNADIRGLDAESGNLDMAADQKAKLESSSPHYLGGVAISRTDPGTTAGPDPLFVGPLPQGSGRWCADLLSALEKKTHCTYSTACVSGPRNPKITLSDAIGAMDQALKQGLPVPIVIGKGKEPDVYAHYVLATNVRGQTPDREFQIHDPGDGKTTWVMESQLDPGPLAPPIAGLTHLAAIEVPTSD